MYAVQFRRTTVLDPASDAIYYLGTQGDVPGLGFDLALSPAQAVGDITVVGLYAIVRVNGDPASDEAVTVGVYEDGDATFAGAAALAIDNPPLEFFNAALSFPVAAGVRWGMYILTPSWVSAPTQVTIEGLVYVEDDGEAEILATVVALQMSDQDIAKVADFIDDLPGEAGETGLVRTKGTGEAGIVY